MFTMPIQSTKRCRACYRELPFDNFGKVSSTKDGLNSQCKDCATEQRNGQSGRLERLYGVTREQHQQMYMDQGMCCALCGKPVPYNKIHTDHDHKMDKVRGLLCSGCNVGLGLLGDTLEGLQRAIKYLKTGVGR